MKFIFLLLCTVLVFHFSLHAQYKISGTITETSAIPVNEVNVYIPELTKGTTSDVIGKYELSDIPNGKFTIQFSKVGYKVEIFTVQVSSAAQTLDVTMQLFPIETPEIVVTAVQNTAADKTSENISSITAEQMRSSGSFNISDGLSKLPGVSQMTTGVAISKPVIRGLYGNRIQVLLNGLRFDNQQWQDEHGLGLSDVGIDKVELIKGPASVLYGSEAEGGVLNVIEEKAAPINTVKGDFNLRLFSNTFGGATDLGLKGNNGKRNWRIHLGTESNADYSDGKNTRVKNSRFSGLFGKASLGFNHGKWVNQNNYMFSKSYFGFIMENFFDRLPNDARFSRSMQGPHHEVMLNILSSQNTWFFDRSKIKFNFGSQSNQRLEQEGGNRISLNMNLLTALYNGQFSHQSGENGEVIIASQGLFQTNRNYGARIIIPDANMWEEGLSIFFSEKKEKLTLEGGAGYLLRNIHTFETDILNTASSEIKPFNVTLPSTNGSIGIVLNPIKNFLVKANVSTGVRSANLAEFSSNGLHEGTFRWEIGDPDLKNEMNLNNEISFQYETKQVSFFVGVYYNSFKDYIYQAPGGDSVFGFTVYRYLQQDAALYGGEVSADFRFPFLKWLDLHGAFSNCTGTLSDGSYLPFIPAQKLNGVAEVNIKGGKKFSEIKFTIGADYYFKQDHPAQFETTTPSYWLLSAGVSGKFTMKKMVCNFSLSGNNLLNEVYFDHLSRFKDYNIYNIGRNINLNLNFPFQLK